MNQTIRLACAALVIGLSRPLCDAFAADTDACITGSISLPLLGGRTDAPIVPVRVEGHEAAMYVSPAFDQIYVRDAAKAPFDFAYQGYERPVEINGYHVISATEITIDDLQLGPIDLANIEAVKLHGLGTQMVQGRPIVGVLGYNLMRHAAVLLDMPHGRLTLFTIGQTADCQDVAGRMLGDDARSVPLAGKDDGWRIPVSIDGQKRLVGLNPDLAVFAVPSSWTEIPELAPDAVARGKLVVIHYDEKSGLVSDGREIAIHDVDIGGTKLPDMTATIERDTDKAVLGTPFFADRIVLFDFPQNRFYFIPRTRNTRPPGHHLHFEETIVARTSVRQREGTVQQ
ncbi:hypothetical protein [Tanticharoenia sakaeratensis]|uniref:Uncharacterized protein n=1 Tax=Tanticharoenia sakaeratensis NBRC 103193 TaxID=1231623 RepID=A0A0D6MLB2_9PROT|nr:hypothetical protein [Tanticharoenia sakaeratensis]GAN54083.1 hypothetical protein Tasa_016_003 [Tanticharoenia sakaeratensis NBRC 103193]GBQ24756.1 hypothetical protein AA103193_2847 [Tanticharoenia sakaeratensis NBRC 103193]